MKIVLVPKVTNPMICRFFEPRYVFDLGVLSLGTYIEELADVSIKSIFGFFKKKYLTAPDLKLLSQKRHLENLVDYILAGSPDVVGISTIDSSLINTVILAQAIKQRSRYTKIILGGPGVFYNHIDVMSHFTFIDYCIRGEGEAAFAKFIDHLAGKVDAASVPSLVFRRRGAVVSNPLAPPIDVNRLPFLSFNLYDTDPQTLKSLSCEPGRGCPFKCTFCTTTGFWENSYRVKTPQRLADEIRHYSRLYPKVSHFDFHSHDNFLANKSYLQQLGDAFKRRDLEFSWNCSSRIDQLDDEFIDLLRKSGCSYIDCGIESGSTRIRQLIRKNIDIKKTLVNASKLLSNDIGVATNFMFGFPTETLEELEETFESACRCVSAMADIVFCFLSPLKGTRIYSQFSDLLVAKGDDHLHDFTDASVNFLHGADGLRRTNDYFADQLKMFRNEERYDRIVTKIRKVDSVFLFTHYSDIFLKIKERLNIQIYDCKSALKDFPYSKDLFHFLAAQFKQRNIAPQMFVSFIHPLLELQQKTNLDPRSELEDITLFLGAELYMRQHNIRGFGKERTFINMYIDDFFANSIGLNLYESFKGRHDYNLCEAFAYTAEPVLFLGFAENRTGSKISLALGFQKEGANKIFYRQTDANENAARKVKTVAEIIAGEFHASRKNGVSEGIGT